MTFNAHKDMTKSIYFRKSGTLRGSLCILQLVIGSRVLSLYRNRSWSNGDVHGWKFEMLSRGNTAL